ncbi:hypothetical protein AAFA46_09360 [Oscillospiraceae bacterium WX1]
MSKIQIPAVLLAHILVIVLVYILQSMIFAYLPIAGVFPVILPLVVVGIAMFEGSARGAGYGLLAGMLCDISFNQPVALMTITLTIIGIGVGILSETVLARGFPTFLISCLGALLLTAFVSMFSLLFFSRVEFSSLLRVGFLQSLYSIFFAFPIYPIIRSLSRRVPSA